jgi:DNA-binding transcriptional regulator LsrR (DeoR family)
MSHERLELLARVASLYYEDGLNQERIAQHMGYSRSMVSRLLAEAHQQHVVEIRVHHPLERHAELESELQQRLGVKTVRVLKRGQIGHALMLRRLGGLAAPLVEELLHDQGTLGVSWGTGVSEVANALKPRSRTNIHVVQLVGLIGAADSPEIDNPELAQRFARTLGGRYSILPAPLLVDSAATREAMLNDYRVQRVLAHVRQMDLAILGIGAVEPQYSTLVRAGCISTTQAAELLQAGAVGDVSAIYFDRTGRLVETPLTRRIIAVSAQALAEVPHKLGIAGGQAKPLPILGAVRAGLVNMLVTDDVAASGVLRELDAEPEPEKG